MKSFFIAILLIVSLYNISNATYSNLRGCTVSKVSVQSGVTVINGSMTGNHDVVKVDLLQGSTSTSIWFEATSWGKIMMSTFLTASSSGKTVDVSYQDGIGQVILWDATNGTAGSSSSLFCYFVSMN
jgi:hypothetical protein